MIFTDYLSSSRISKHNDSKWSNEYSVHSDIDPHSQGSGYLRSSNKKNVTGQENIFMSINYFIYTFLIDLVLNSVYIQTNVSHQRETCGH